MKRNVWLLIAILVVLAATGTVWSLRASGKVTFKSAYQAVLLTNGSVYYGKLEGLGGPYPVLRDVFYVQAAADANTKQTTNVLIRRGKEWHGPDYMLLNANHILLVEPVSPGSRVATLIAEAQ
ncbi:MAG: hypothetical protein ABSC05_33015 [Candidatus Solibacter sp.]|jgi:hypothetical protein